MKAVLTSKEFIGSVNPIIKQTIEKCEKILIPKKSYVIAVAQTDDKFVISKMNGAGGYTPYSQKMTIDVSTRAPKWKEGLRSSAAHEFNHIIRLQYLGLYSFDEPKMIDIVASEGLAQVFEEEITGKKPPYSHAISEKDSEKFWKTMKSYKKNDYYVQFFTNAWQKKYPLWCGYTVAYMIVKNRKEELGLPWPELMKMDTKKLVGNG